MAQSRYETRDLIQIEKNGVYEKILDNRGAGQVTYYETAHHVDFTQEQIDSMDFRTHVWTVGDRFYKLSEEYYGTTKFWWIIARFNAKPTESHVKIGDRIRIPFPLDIVLHVYGIQGRA